MGQIEILEDWFIKFRSNRILTNKVSGIDGRPLYGYQLTTQELFDLKDAFRCYKGLSKRDDQLNRYYGGAFVLLASEFYRREYERQDWGWTAVYEYIGIVGDLPDRERLIECGFRYWKLPAIKNEDGKNRKFLGSVLNQGGLPWKLVQNKTDSFGRVIHECFNNYVDIMYQYNSLLPEIEHLSKKFYIPDYLANSQNFELISEVVKTVIGLQKKYASDAMITDPTDYLNQHEPDWIYKFPIPIDQENAQTLLKSWFTSAKEQVEKGQRGPKNSYNHFLADHIIKADHVTVMMEQWLSGLQTRLIQPEVLSIAPEKLLSNPISSRIELLIYENDVVIAKGKTFYAEQNDLNCLIIKCRVDASQITVRRRNPYQPLIVKLMSAGSLVYEEVIDNSVLSEENAPLFFLPEDDSFKCIADASSCITTHAQGYLYIHHQSDITTQIECDVLHQGTAAKWILVQDQIDIQHDGNLFTYEVNSKDPVKAVHLQGQEDITIKGSRAIYRKFPELKNAPEDAIEYINGQRLSLHERQRVYGNVNYQVKTSDGKTILMRRFAILPPNYHILTQPIHLDRQQLSTAIYLHESTKAVYDTLDFELLWLPAALSAEEAQPNHFILSVWDADNIPAFVTVAVPSSHHNETLKLYIPLSVIGMRVQKDHQFLPQNTHLSLSLDELMGHDVVLQSSNDIRSVSIEMKVHAVRSHQNSLVPLVTRNILKPHAKHVRLNLIAFKDEIEQLLSIISDLDSYVSLKISAFGLGEYDIEIKRFHIQGEILADENESNHNLTILLQGLDEASIGKMDFQWMPLVHPQQAQSLSIERAQLTAHNKIQVLFNEIINHEPLGLVIASSDSELTLRPILNINSKALDKASYDSRSIEYAIIHYHPIHNKSAFDDVFEAMAQDLLHPAWGYYAHLMKAIPVALSLSTFAAWKQLITNQKLVTIAFFKLNFSLEFCLRMRDELGVIWEAIDFENWQNAWNLYVSGLCPNPQDFIALSSMFMQIFAQYMDKLESLIPMRNILKDKVHGSRIKDVLSEEAIQILRTSKNNLIAHNTDNQWPLFLQDEFKQWLTTHVIKQNLLSDEFTRILLSSEEPLYHYPSLILPVYMAAVSAGVSKFGDVSEYGKAEDKNKFEKLIELKFAYQQISNFDHEWYSICYYYALIEFMGWS